MNDKTEPSLSLVTQLLRQVLSKVGTTRDDMAVTMAMLPCQGGTMSGLLNEVRAMHAQHSRQSSRVRGLEGHSAP